MAAPDKAAQESEGRARAEAGLTAGEGGDALATVDDSAPGADLGAAPQRQRAAGEPEPQRAAPPVRSPKDDARSAITARFRENRGQEIEDRDDISEFTRSGMPPEFAEPNAAIAEVPEPEPVADVAAAPEPAPAAKPQTFKVKVNGQERELTLEEMTAQAQIALASDGILEATKSRLREADQILNSVKQRVDQSGKHHAGQNDTQPPADQNADPAALAPEHHEDKYDKLIQSIQFGDPADAKALLKDTISEEATAAAQTTVTKALQTGRLKDEGARAQKVLGEFEAKYPEIAKDTKARAVIESDVVGQQIEDMQALGVNLALLRQDGLAPTPGDIAEAHRWYRSEGYKVKAPQELLETATKNYLDWRGVTTAKPAEPAPDPTKRVIDVTVDRTVRRQAIPQQPGRTVVPRHDAQRQQPAQPRDRSSIVQAEIARRNAPRGKVAV